MKNIRSAYRSLCLLLKKYPIYLFFELVQIILSTISTIIPVNMVNRIVKVYNDSNYLINDFQTFMDSIGYYILIQTCILLLIFLIGMVIKFLEKYIETGFSVYVSTLLLKKLDNIDYSFHENPKFLDNYTRALEHGDRYIYSVATGQIDLIKTIIQSISLLVVVYKIQYFAVVYSLLVGVVYYFLRRKIGKMEFLYRTNILPLKRKRNYLGRVMYVKDSMADIKTTDVSNVLLSRHSDIGENIISTSKKMLKKGTFFYTTGGILLSSIYPMVLGIVTYFIMDEKDLSALASITIAATLLSKLVSTFSNQLTNIQNDVLECQVSFDLLDMQSEIEGKNGIEVLKDFEELKVNNVSFSYDENKVLMDVSLYIKKGEKIVIVGENGAGKTTLVKLLLRLYDASCGEITYNGISYKDINTSSLRKKVGAVFQNSEVYSVSVAENVLLRKCTSKEDEDLVIEALKFSGLYDYVMTLEEGINTMVTREFYRRGTIFSGGQIQKLAIARGYAQNYNLFILDEPSSALDPIAETKMYHNMLELGKDKTLVFISHRLSAAVNADRIYLFEHGRVIEYGNHEELMKNENGTYRKMFESQSEKYLRGDFYD